MITTEKIYFGSMGCGKLERMRENLGMTQEEFLQFYEKQKAALSEVLRLEEELKAAKEAYVNSCMVEHQ